jgi:HK97 gp10 family phage protein
MASKVWTPEARAKSRQASGLRGVSALRKKLRRMPKEATEALKKEVAEAAELIRFEQLARVPIDQGDLAASIEIKISADKLKADVGPGARTKRGRKRGGWRAHFTEFGTVDTPARPFVFPALESVRGEITSRLDAATDKAFAAVAALPLTDD